NAKIGYIRRKLRSRLRFPYLREDEIGVRVRLDVVVHDQSHYSIGGRVQRIHVVHIVDPAHLLFDRGCDGLLDGLRIGADVRGDYLNLRRDDIRKLGHGKTSDGNRADDQHNDGDDHRHDGAVDNKLGHGLAAFRRCGLLDFDDGAVSDFLQVFDTHDVVCLHSVFDEPHCAVTFSDFDGSYAHHTVDAYNGHFVASLELVHL